MAHRNSIDVARKAQAQIGHIECVILKTGGRLQGIKVFLAQNPGYHIQRELINSRWYRCMGGKYAHISYILGTGHINAADVVCFHLFFQQRENQ